MPDMVKEFIRRASLKTDYLFIVLTYGAHHGGAAEIADLFVQSFYRYRQNDLPHLFILKN